MLMKLMRFGALAGVLGVPGLVSAQDIADTIYMGGRDCQKFRVWAIC
jgi:hypothetical protein